MPHVSVGHVDLQYHIIGSGPPIVLIEGFGMDHMSWIFQIPDLQTYLTLIVFDNRGIGQSTRCIRRYTTRQMANDVATLLPFLHSNKAHILRFSMGGMIAQEFGIQYPSMVDSLLLCSTFAKRVELKALSQKRLNTSYSLYQGSLCL